MFCLYSREGGGRKGRPSCVIKHVTRFAHTLVGVHVGRRVRMCVLMIYWVIWWGVSPNNLISIRFFVWSDCSGPCAVAFPQQGIAFGVIFLSRRRELAFVSKQVVTV